MNVQGSRLQSQLFNNEGEVASMLGGIKEVGGESRTREGSIEVASVLKFQRILLLFVGEIKRA